MTATSIVVGMAEIHVAKGPAKYTCLGLGSCIGLCALDKVSNVSGCAHIMLPEAYADKSIERPGKFANTAVPELLTMLERLGAHRSRMVWAMAGGAQVFKFSANTAGKLDIGVRNAEAVETLFKSLGLKCIAREVGGNLGRTVMMDAETGLITVRTVSLGEKPLCNLRG
ncbi:MAG: hypothetical protein KF784_13505 [Fimbriimonadaceae bacterium]|nr:hypothetical protein [Fimbriimonadaceae bacterium]